MDAKALITLAVIGIVAGFLASILVGGGGLLFYLITGVLGAFVGGFLVNATGMNLRLGHPLANQIAVATIGAIVVILLAHLIA